MDVRQNIHLNFKQLTRNTYYQQQKTESSPFSVSKKLNTQQMAATAKSPSPHSKTALFKTPSQHILNFRLNQQVFESKLHKTQEFKKSASPLRTQRSTSSTKKKQSSKQSEKGQFNSSNFTTTHDTNQSQKKHNFQNGKEKLNKRQFLNAYRSKENKANPLDLVHNVEAYQSNKEVLKELAGNQQIVEWVTLMVNFHKKRSEEKKILDYSLQCIYKVLFPEQKSSTSLCNLISSIQDLIADSQHIFQYQKQNLFERLEQIKQDVNTLLKQPDHYQLSECTLVKIQEMISLFKFQDAPLISSGCKRRQESSVIIHNNNITVSEIEEPANLNQIDDPRSLRVSNQSFQIENQPTITPKKKLINEPQQMQARLQEKFDQQIKEYPQPVSVIQYRSQSEGQKLIKHIEESLESISQYMRISDSSQSLQNTLQFQQQQQSQQNSFTRKQLNISQILGSSPLKEKSRDSSLTERFKASAKLLEEQSDKFRKERQTWEEDRKSLQIQLDEAIMINTKLLQKVKRLEGQVRDLLSANVV